MNSEQDDFESLVWSPEDYISCYYYYHRYNSVHYYCYYDSSLGIIRNLWYFILHITFSHNSVGLWGCLQVERNDMTAIIIVVIRQWDCETSSTVQANYPYSHHSHLFRKTPMKCHSIQKLTWIFVADINSPTISFMMGCKHTYINTEKLPLTVTQKFCWLFVSRII